MSMPQSLSETVLAEATAAEEVDSAAEAAPEAAPESGEKSEEKLSWEEATKRVPPNVAKLMRKMQADYTRKTQEVAAQRKELSLERESLLKVKFEAPEDVGEYDPFNEGSITKRIEAEVAKRMKQLLEPMQQEAELLKAENDYNSFLVENPDFKTDQDLRAEVQNLLEKNPALDLTTAYWAAKGKQGKFKAPAKTEADSRRSQATKEAAAVVAPSRKAPPPAKPDRKTLSGMTNADLLALAQTMSRG